MPKKRPGQHGLHIYIPEQDFKTLQQYCAGSIEKISATGIITLLVEHFVTDFVHPRLSIGELVSAATLQKTIPLSVKATAAQLEPTAFDSAENPNE